MSIQRRVVLFLVIPLTGLLLVKATEDLNTDVLSKRVCSQRRFFSNHDSDNQLIEKREDSFAARYDKPESRFFFLSFIFLHLMKKAYFGAGFLLALLIFGTIILAIVGKLKNFVYGILGQFIFPDETEPQNPVINTITDTLTGIIPNLPPAVVDFFTELISTNDGDEEETSSAITADSLNPFDNEARAKRAIKPIIYETCKASTDKEGICIPKNDCELYGGKSNINLCSKEEDVCCINTIRNCGMTVTLNNTYWRSSKKLLSYPSTCATTIRMNSRDNIKKRRNICQIRLDFLSFKISQPDAETVCSTDNFQVEGNGTNKVPTICGDNKGQHMYINVPKSEQSLVEQIRLIFDFGVSNTTRIWNIRIAMLPCRSNYLAPTDCLQYFIDKVSGTVSSFNWKSVKTGSNSTRQLANQDYKICFRNETIDSKVTKKICYTPCKGVNSPFSLSTANNDIAGLAETSMIHQSQEMEDNCDNDYLMIKEGFNPKLTSNKVDRYCGEALNPLPSQNVSVTVCSIAKPFAIHYRTNGDETKTAMVDGEEGSNFNGNQGFCLDFHQK